MNDWIDCTGDVVTGDTIRFEEAVWGGNHRKPKFVGNRTITATVTNDSYGQSKQQHTFSLLVRESSGTQAIASGKVIQRKGRNVYRNGTQRLRWKDESQRETARDEKHQRGNRARQVRAERVYANLIGD